MGAPAERAESRRRGPDVPPYGRVTDETTLKKFRLVAKALADAELGEASFPLAAQQIDSFNQPLRGLVAVVPTFDTDGTRKLFGLVMNKTEIAVKKNPAADPASLDDFAAELPQALIDAQKMIDKTFKDNPEPSS